MFLTPNRLALTHLTCKGICHLPFENRTPHLSHLNFQTLSSTPLQIKYTTPLFTSLCNSIPSLSLSMDPPAVLAFLATFLALQSLTADADFLSPLLAPFLDDVCKEVGCGKGKCKASHDSDIPFICECEPGWKQTLSGKANHDFLHYLPCVIPDCTVDHSCTTAQPHMSEKKEPPLNESLLDPCNWAYCGEGSCIKSTSFGYKCECKEGYDNLLNVTAFPCFKKCAFGMDCARLGITVSNETATSTPKFDDKNENHAITILHGKFLWLMILMISLAMVPWK